MKCSRSAKLAAILGIAAALSSFPAQAQIAVLGSSIQERVAAPGSVYEGSFAVRNDSPVPQEVRISLTDYRFDAGGRTEFAPGGTSARSNARWIQLGAQVVIVAPGQTSVIPYKVQVPSQGTDAAGSYWSVAMIEGPALPKRGASTGSVQVQAVMRQAIQLVTHIGETGAAGISFSNVRIVADSAGSKLVFDTENTGTRARRLALSVEVYSQGGKLVGRFSNTRGLVYPGCSVRQAFAIGAVEKGEYLAFIVADAGKDDLFAGNFVLKL